jgi:hypothetical protein
MSFETYRFDIKNSRMMNLVTEFMDLLKEKTEGPKEAALVLSIITFFLKKQFGDFGIQVIDNQSDDNEVSSFKDWVVSDTKVSGVCEGCNKEVKGDLAFRLDTSQPELSLEIGVTSDDSDEVHSLMFLPFSKLKVPSSKKDTPVTTTLQ